MKSVRSMIKEFLFFSPMLGWFLCGNVSAAVVIPPPDLNPGDQYRLVFITSGTRDATSANINDYNSFVNAQAALAVAPEFPTSGWSVIGSTPTVDARDNTGTNPASGVGVPIYRVDGVRIADNNADLWDGNAPAASISITQQGDSYPNTSPPCASFPYCLAWTGTVGFGTGIAASSLGGSGSAAAGNIFLVADINTFSWIQGYFDSKTRSYPFYAMSSVLTVGSAPPATYTIGGSISGLAGSVTLQNNGTDNLIRTTNGSFTFATALADSSAYVVTVLTQPTGQTCTVSASSGTIVSANISDVSVTCVNDVAAPPSAPPKGVQQIPTLSAYGLVLTALGLLLLVARRLRISARRK